MEIRKIGRMSKVFFCSVLACFFLCSAMVMAEDADSSGDHDSGVVETQAGHDNDGNAVIQNQKAPAPDALYYSIAATMALSCMAGAYAVGKIGAAVMGAAAEKPEVIGKALVVVALGEGIVLFGFLISLFLYTKI